MSNKVENSLRFVAENLVYEGQDNAPLIFNIKNIMLKGADEIKRIESENAKLRARLDKAVELPCKVGDTVYKVYGECNGSDCPYNGAFGQWRCNYKGKDRCKAFIDTRAFRYSDISSINKTIFVSKEAAEARLAELKAKKMICYEYEQIIAKVRANIRRT